MIKQDLIQRVVERTGLVRTKAEASVDAIFESMKQALAEGDRIELRGFGVFTVNRERPASDATRAPVPKSPSLPARQSASNPEKISTSSSNAGYQPPHASCVASFPQLNRHGTLPSNPAPPLHHPANPSDPAPERDRHTSDMTSPTLIAEPANQATARPRRGSRIAVPLILLVVTTLSTTSVGMRYMYNFTLGRPPLASDADVLPFGWVLLHLKLFATGLPFSLTLIGILLAHEFGHYFACRSFGVHATFPYLLPAPSLSGSFGAVIRLKSRVRSRSALIVIGAMGPIAGFIVALFTIVLGLNLSHYSPVDIVPRVQAPLVVSGLHQLLNALRGDLHNPARSIFLLIPHPILTASWMGLLITALNLIPAGQLDGGHILYAISPAAHKIASKLVVVALFVLGFFYWSGWVLWGVILLTPGMRHPIVPDDDPIKPWHRALVPICLVILLLAGTYEPFKGYSLLHIIRIFPHRYHH